MRFASESEGVPALGRVGSGLGDMLAPGEGRCAPTCGYRVLLKSCGASWGVLGEERGGVQVCVCARVCVCISHLFIHLLRHLDYFHIWAIVNHVAINIGVHISLRYSVFISFG